MEVLVSLGIIFLLLGLLLTTFKYVNRSANEVQARTSLNTRPSTTNPAVRPGDPSCARRSSWRFNEFAVASSTMPVVRSWCSAWNLRTAASVVGPNP